MGRVQREWLRRIGGYEEVIVRRRRPAGEPGPGGDEEAPPPDGAEDGEGAEALEADDGEASPREGDGEDEGRSQAEPPPLSVPEEVARANEEKQRQKARGMQNLGFAPQAFTLEGHYLRALATRFARMVSKVAEDSADMPSQGDDEWDLNELRQRRFTGRLVSQCRMTREKRKVAVVLDTSPSCEHQARLFGSVARVAEELGDCELYDAPNFVIHARRLDDAWESLPEAEREWNFRRRVVLAFGDFDGIERICQASALRGNRIYWFCCEERQPVLESNRDKLLKEFKGHYFPATTLVGLMKAMRRVR